MKKNIQKNKSKFNKQSHKYDYNMRFGRFRICPSSLKSSINMGKVMGNVNEMGRVEPHVRW